MARHALHLQLHIDPFPQPANLSSRGPSGVELACRERLWGSACASPPVDATRGRRAAVLFRCAPCYFVASAIYRCIAPQRNWINMGRPPIGIQAMTSTERSRRRRDQMRRNATKLATELDATADDADDTDDRAEEFFRVHGQDWCDRSSDKSILSLIEELRGYAEMRREDVAWLIMEYREGISLQIPDFCLRCSSTVSQDATRKTIVSILKEVNVAGHLAAVGKAGALAPLSVMAFCHWAVSQVATASQVDAFFASLTEGEKNEEAGPKAISEARSELTRLSRSRRSSPHTVNRHAMIILWAWVDHRTGSEFKRRSGKLPTLEELRGMSPSP
jgi:hypothetical protein